MQNSIEFCKNEIIIIINIKGKSISWYQGGKNAHNENYRKCAHDLIFQNDSFLEFLSFFEKFWKTVVKILRTIVGKK